MNTVTKRRTPRTLFARTRIAGGLAAIAFAGLFMGACKDSGPRTIDSIVIAPTTVTLSAGGTQQFTMVGTDNDGNQLTNLRPVWAVVAGGGTITQTGLFTAGTVAGTFTNTVSVTCSGKTVFATVIINAGPLATITVTPQTTTLAPGATQVFTAVGRDANGNVISPFSPVWSVRAPNNGTISDTGTPTGPHTALFTAGPTLGSFPNTVRAASGTIFDEADVIVVAGPLASITVTPQTTTLPPGGTQVFTAVGRDASGNVISPFSPVWSVLAPNNGTIVDTGTPTGPHTATFTAGATLGTFLNSVQAASGSISDQADVIVVAAAAPPPPALGFTILADVSVTCTNGSIIGNVGINQPGPTGIFIPTTCPVSGGTVQIGTLAAQTAYNNFLTAYTNTAAIPCQGAPLTGTLAGQNLPPGVYCFTAGAALTGVLTLTGPSTATWLFKIGTTGTGALATNLFSVVMAGGGNPCNVQWWTQQGATMTDSDFKGTVLAGTDATTTRGTLNGNFWARGNVTITGTAVTGCP